MRAKAFSTAVLVFLTGAALAETAPPAKAPPPRVDIPCDGFARNPDGSWTPTRDVNVPISGGVVTVGSAVSFKPGVPSRGFDFDLGAALERQCTGR
jgi:hypothetical protein